MKEITKERINEVVDRVEQQISKELSKEYAKVLLQNEVIAREQPARDLLGLRFAQENCANAIKGVLYELLVE